MFSQNLTKRETTGAFALIDSLVRHEVKHIFGYPGGAILPIYDELYAWEKEGFIEHILVRHEQCATHAADAYARATGKVGVCFGTSGARRHKPSYRNCNCSYRFRSNARNYRPSRKVLYWDGCIPRS